MMGEILVDYELLPQLGVFGLHSDVYGDDLLSTSN